MGWGAGGAVTGSCSALLSLQGLLAQFLLWKNIPVTKAQAAGGPRVALESCGLTRARLGPALVLFPPPWAPREVPALSTDMLMPEAAPLDQPALLGTRAQDKLRRRCYRDLVPVSLELRTSLSCCHHHQVLKDAPHFPGWPSGPSGACRGRGRVPARLGCPRGGGNLCHLPSKTWHESQFCEQLRPRPV